MQALSEGALPLSVLAKEWSRVVLDAVRTVFWCGRSGQAVVRGPCSKALTPHGVFRLGHEPCKRNSNSKAKHQALRDAMRRGDTNAAQAARQVFNAKKRRAQRRQALQQQDTFLHDVEKKPRRFWTGFKRGPPQQAFEDMDALTAHWQGLYDVEGCGGLKEGAPSAGELVQGLMADSGPLDGEEADALSAPIAVEELVAAVRKLKYGRMVGPDGLRGEFLKGLYAGTPVFNATLQKWVVVHEYDTSPGWCWGICAP